MVKFKTRQGELIEVSGLGSRDQKIQLFDAFQREKSRIEELLQIDCPSIKKRLKKRKILVKDYGINVVNKLISSGQKGFCTFGKHSMVVFTNELRLPCLPPQIISQNMHFLITFSVERKKIEPIIRRHEITHYLFTLAMADTYGLAPFDKDLTNRYKIEEYMYNEGFARVVSKLPEFGKPMITSALKGTPEREGFEIVKRLWEEIKDIRKVLDVIISRLNPSNY